MTDREELTREELSRALTRGAQRAPPAKLGSMPTQEASSIEQDNAVHARRRAWGRYTANSARTQNDYLPLPRGAKRARLWGRSAARSGKAASTDGCLRLASSNSEGAGAEREGFEPSAGF